MQTPQDACTLECEYDAAHEPVQAISGRALDLVPPAVRDPAAALFRPAPRALSGGQPATGPPLVRKPTGPAPAGYAWDGVRGVWVDAAGKVREPKTTAPPTAAFLALSAAKKAARHAAAAPQQPVGAGEQHAAGRPIFINSNGQA